MDAEVYGIIKTTRNFTNRTDIWTRGFQKKVAQQLRPQLWSLVNNYESLQKKREMVKIHLRLSVNGININDDFQWDPNVPNQCPIAFAQMLARDLKLPDDAVPAIATAIAEQLGGIQVEAPPKSTSAFHVDLREQQANVNQIASFHSPKR